MAPGTWRPIHGGIGIPDGGFETIRGGNVKDGPLAESAGFLESSLTEDAETNRTGPNAAMRGALAGKYEVLGELGRGGFGTVYKARHGGLNKVVAIKVLHNTLVMDPVTRARFELEAKAGANLAHPNLVSVFDYGFTDRDEPYLVMEFVEGVSLEQFIATHPPTTDDLLNILIQVGKALRYLHDSNIVHRDLKTSNILVQDIAGERYARLLDLGIAKVFTPESNEKNVQLTSTGMIFGSPAFMSPEQCQGQPIDGRSDIYSFGCVMYQCFTGELPFSGENSLQVILKHLNDAPKELPYKTQREYELSQVVSKCLAKEAAQRYQNVKELLDALQKIAVASPNEKPHVTQTSISRAYVKPNAGEANISSKPAMHVAATTVVLVLLAVLVAIPVWGIIQQQMANKMAAPIPTATSPTAPPSSSQPVASPPVAAAAQDTALDKIRSERLTVEKAAADQAAERMAAERLALQKASDQLAAERAATEKAALEKAALEAAIREKVNAMAAASTQRSQLIQETLRSYDQPTQSLNQGNVTLREYNDRMARQNGLSRR